jgi:hypothetical protein
MNTVMILAAYVIVLSNGMHSWGMVLGFFVLTENSRFIAASQKNFFEPASEWFSFNRIPDSELHEKYQSEDIELYLITRHKM